MIYHYATRFDEMTNEDLRIAIAESLGWTDVHWDGRDLVADIPGVALFVPLVVPNWPADIADIQSLERTMIEHGCNQARIAGSENLNTRQRAQAALAILRDAALLA